MNMSRQSSEQILSGLEHSSKPTVELLDDAARAIGLHPVLNGASYAAARVVASTSDVARFREQWVLKWLIKRLSQATSDTSDTGLTSHCRTWSLLSHVLEAIPVRVSRGILIERKFHRTLGECLQSVSDSKPSSAKVGQSNAYFTDQESGRPGKRRRVSDEGLANGVSILATIADRAVDQVSSILCPSTSEKPLTSSSKTSAAIDDAGAIALFLGQVLSFADTALQQSSTSSQGLSPDDTALLCAVERLLILWQPSTAISSKSTKQKIHLVFNEHVLLPALRVLNWKTTTPTVTLFRVLERLIAVHAILPARENFQKYRLNTKGSHDPIESDDEIAKVLNEISNTWGRAASELPLHHGGRMLQIAGAIIPLADVSRRKSESPWFEALFLVLNDQAAPEPDYDVVSIPLLDALEAIGVQPASLFWRKYVRNLALSGGASWKVLAKVVHLNRSLFMPGQTEESIASFGLVATAVSRLDDKLEEDTDLFVGGILQPILEESGRSRQLQAFVDAWLGRLAASIDQRRNQSVVQPSMYVWDSPQLLKVFESVCQRYISLPLCRKLLDDLLRAMREPDNGTESQAQLSAMLTIATSIFQPLSASPNGKALLNEYMGPLYVAASAAVHERKPPIDLRWILYRTLNNLLPLGSLEDPMRHLLTILPLKLHSNTEAEVSGGSKKSDVFMERYYCFCLRATCYEQYPQEIVETFEKAVISLRDAFDFFSTQESIDASVSTWDGTVTDMNNINTLLAACTMRLSTMPSSWASSIPASRELLVAAINMVCSNELPTSHQKGLLACTEDLIASITRDASMDVVEIILEVLNDDQRRTVKRLPLVVLQHVAPSINKGQAQKLSELVLNTLQSEGSADHAHFLDNLNAFHAILSNQQTVAKNVWPVYAAALNKSLEAVSMQQVNIAWELIMKISSIIVSRLSTSKPEQQEPGLAEILTWASEKLKKADAGKKDKLVRKFDGLLLLAIIRICSSEKFSTNIRSIQNMMTEVDTQFKEIAPNIIKKLLKKEQSPMSCFLAWKVAQVLDSLALLDAQTLSSVGDAMNHTQTKMKETHPVSTREYISFRNMEDLAIMTAQHGHNAASGTIEENLKAIGQGALATARKRGGLVNGHTDHAEELQRLVPQLMTIVRDGRIQNFANGSVAGSYLCLAALVRQLTHDKLTESPQLVPGLGQLASLEVALTERNAVAFIFRLEVSKTILEKHSAIMNQHIIDTTLTSVALLASSVSRLTLDDRSDAPQPAHIFDRLCSTLSILLVRYRRRITGRYDLLLPALQNLLRCLFCPPSHAQLKISAANLQSKTVFLNLLPHWLNPRKTSSSLTLPPSSAARFSRLLQTLCDPTASSARRALKRPQASQVNLNLTDETKVLKSQVSWHMQYLLQTYCQSALDGFIAPEIKEKLMSGIYAVLSATDIEVMRSVNAGMNESQRAIWKDLYGDWKRYGKWNQL